MSSPHFQAEAVGPLLIQPGLTPDVTVKYEMR